MSLPVLEPPISRGHSLGLSFVEGMKESFPAALKQGALAGGINKMANDTTSRSPMEEYAMLSSIPGITPETVNQLIPFIKDQRQKRYAESLSKNRQGDIAGEGGDTGVPMGVGMKPEQIYQEAQKLMSETGGSLEDATRAVETRNEKDTAYANQVFANRERAKGEFDTTLNNLIQKEGAAAYQDIIGELRQDYYDKVIDRVGNGEDPTKVATSLSRDLLDFAKSRNTLKSLGSDRLSWIYKNSAKKKQISSIRTAYKERDQLEQFKNDLVSYQKLSGPVANSIAYPQSSSVKSSINKFSRIRNPFRSDTPNLERLAKSLTNQDSLQSIALSLRGKNFDPNKFMDYIADENEKGKISLSKHQLLELKNRPTSWVPSLSDILYRTYL